MTRRELKRLAAETWTPSEPLALPSEQSIVEAAKAIHQIAEKFNGLMNLSPALLTATLATMRETPEGREGEATLAKMLEIALAFTEPYDEFFRMMRRRFQIADARLELSGHQVGVATAGNSVRS